MNLNDTPQSAAGRTRPRRELTAEQLIARMHGRERVANMRRRARRIRRSVVALSAALFTAAFMVVYVQIASGHDPALNASVKRATTARGAGTKTSATSGKSSSAGTRSSSTAPSTSTTSSASGGESSSASARESSSSGGESGSSSATGSTSSGESSATSSGSSSSGSESTSGSSSSGGESSGGSSAVTTKQS